MSRDVVTEIHAALRTVASEIDPATVDPQAILVEALDIDSIDFLGFLEALSKRVGVDFPEAVYPEIRSLAAIEAYVTAHTRPAS